MRAVRISALTGPDAAHCVEAEPPRPGPEDVLIDVHAAGVTFPDVLVTRGQHQFKPDLPFTPGYEVAGIVRSAPKGTRFTVGDRVAAIPHFGGYAEQVATNHRLVFPLPSSVSFTCGAGLPLNYLTADYALVRRGALRPGETVLVHGGAGGLGTAAVQLAKALKARVFAVVSSPEKAEIAAAAGADEVIFLDDFRQAVATLTDNVGVDMVFDPVGGDRFTDSLRSLKFEGRLLVLGFTGGEIPTVKVNRLLNRDIDVRGVAFGRPWWLDMDYLGVQWDRLLPHFESGRLSTLVGQTYPLSDASRALRDVDERRAIGKIVLRVS
ncbi:NADPH:quinone oxidoreductase family protein [Amycolatopsis suaedae]|uniref:NADPH:quinone oxidoreductase family protein n=1 Tax=Amycolatopsis suaedae TaxID=2510978 RepID=A0A4Q7J9L0_9PSEU|nr:NADPH:quinone oxidoreductase family protein [Amycolatopsis suaedae]RZQ63907.1 NADPH:quinone oxidoreductase family protein [Amycolatopsis suaedae]